MWDHQTSCIICFVRWGKRNISTDHSKFENTITLCVFIKEKKIIKMGMGIWKAWNHMTFMSWCKTFCLYTYNILWQKVVGWQLCACHMSLKALCQNCEPKGNGGFLKWCGYLFGLIGKRILIFIFRYNDTFTGPFGRRVGINVLFSNSSSRCTG
jgi:hypothetical protein